MPLTHLAEPRPHHLPHPPTTNITIGEDTYTVLGESHVVHLTITSEYRWPGKTILAVFLFFFWIGKNALFLPAFICQF